MAHLFVYGTLMFEPVVELVAGRSFTTQRAWVEGFERRVVVGKPYPGLIESRIAVEPVEGRLWLDVDDASLARLDHYEDDFYERRAIRVAGGDGSARSALCYVVPTTLGHLLAERWDPEAFRSQNLETFLKQLATAPESQSVAERTPRAGEAAALVSSARRR